ncbi:MAG: RIP metalloprotease RseP [Candidatus Omnitrophota bacterium]
MSILIFLIVLSILIIVHELGHFATAKSLGVKVERFAVGFGPKLFSFMFHGTEFAVCLIPLGGYVKMSGDERSEHKGEAHEYYSKPPGHRALIVLMGPVVNYVLALVCFYFVFLFGYPTLSAKVGELIKDYPAQSAGLEVNDQILRINNKEIKSWEDLQQYISTSKESELNFVFLRDGKEKQLVVKPSVEELTNIFGQKERIRVVGIRPQEEIIVLKHGAGESVVKSFERLGEITVTTYKALYRIATGAMSAKDSMTGPIGIFYIIKKAAEMGLSYLLYVMAIISASLAIFNLLPLPVLDGGHLFLLGIEKVRGKPLSNKADEALSRVGLSLILCLAAFVFYSDLIRYGWLDKIMGLWRHLGL